MSATRDVAGLRRLAIWPEAAMAVVLFSAFFAQRLYLPLDIRERQPAILEFLPLCTVLLAGAITLRSRARSLAPLATRQFLLLWGPYLALSLVLPIIGVAAGQFPLRGLAAVRVPLVAISAIVIGAEVRAASSGGGGFAAWKRPMVVAAVAVVSYAILQQILVSHLMPAGPWDAIVEWDRSTQRAYGLSVIYGRANGFFTNPNILGVWAGITLLVGLFAIPGRARYLVIAAALGALVLSQSRGPALAVLVSLLLVFAAAIRRQETPHVRSLLPYAAIVGAVTLGWGLLAITGAPTGGLIDRLAEAARFIAGGGDPNFSGRVHFWTAGLALLESHPFGTFGPPEVLLGTAVDSEWVRTLLQGGPLLVLALALALLGGLLLPDGNRPERRVLRAVSMLIIVAGVAEIPLQYPPAIIYWALVGSVLAAPAGAAIVPSHGLAAGDHCSSSPGAGEHPPHSLLMVATIAPTLDAFMRPHATALRQSGWRVDGMARGIVASTTARTVYSSIWEIGWSRRPMALGNLLAIRRVREVVRRGAFDIVHVHTPIAAFITRYALRSRGAGGPAVIYTAHGFHFHRGAGRLRNMVYRTLEQMASRWTDELVVINDEDHQAAVDRRFVPPGHLHLIRGVGLDFGAFDPIAVPPEMTAALRHRHHLPASAPLLASVAELNRNKNPGYLVSGFARMRRRDAHLVMAGEGILRDEVERLAHQLGVGDRVHLIGRSGEVPALLRSATLFALVSRREGLPVSMIEAMALGTPVVGTDTRGIRDLAGDGRGILVPQDEPAALAAALDRILADPGAAAAMAARARAYVHAELGIDRIVAEYGKVYEQALAGRHAKPAPEPPVS